MTAHFMVELPDRGLAQQTGVIDAYQRLYGHEGLHVVDGAAISANFGVNPSLTITAQAERTFALWPKKGEPESRPPTGPATSGFRPCRRAGRRCRRTPRPRCGSRPSGLSAALPGAARSQERAEGGARPEVVREKLVGQELQEEIRHRGGRAEGGGEWVGQRRSGRVARGEAYGVTAGFSCGPGCCGLPVRPSARSGFLAFRRLLRRPLAPSEARSGRAPTAAGSSSARRDPVHPSGRPLRRLGVGRLADGLIEPRPLPRLKPRQRSEAGEFGELQAHPHQAAGDLHRGAGGLDQFGDRRVRRRERGVNAEIPAPRRLSSAGQKSGGHPTPAPHRVDRDSDLGAVAAGLGHPASDTDAVPARVPGDQGEPGLESTSVSHSRSSGVSSGEGPESASTRSRSRRSGRRPRARLRPRARSGAPRLHARRGGRARLRIRSGSPAGGRLPQHSLSSSLGGGVGVLRRA